MCYNTHTKRHIITLLPVGVNFYALYGYIKLGRSIYAYD